MLTGAPGAGKTTVLTGLQTLGYAVVPEVARRIIADRKARGLPPRPAPEAFARQILEHDIEQYREAASLDGLTFFDRSILDALGMLEAAGALSKQERSRVLEKYAYCDRVFVFPPWADIYQTDSERDQTFAEAEAVHASICAWYRQCGYDILAVPFGSVQERCDYILEVLS